MPANSTASSRTRNRTATRPPKPYADFPLTPAPNGYWVKKIRGDIRRFGRWGHVVNGVMVRLDGDGVKAALDLYLEQRDDLQAGREPQGDTDQVTVGKLCFVYMEEMRKRLDDGTISPNRFSDLNDLVDLIVNCFGKSRTVESLLPADFAKLREAFPKTWGLTTKGAAIRRIRGVFNYASHEDNNLIPTPVRFGTNFREPTKTQERQYNQQKKDKQGDHYFIAEEIHSLLEVASVPLKAMILLGINAGFGNNDCASLPFTRINFKGGDIDWPRPKTAITRRCVLWPETIAAIEAAWTQRPKPRHADDGNLLFLTHHGRRWVRTEQVLPNPKKPNRVVKPGIRFQRFDAIGLQFGRLLKEAGVSARGRGFYALRHTFSTVAETAGDLPAKRLMMGHADGSIDETYRATIWTERLEKVSDFVRAWFRGGKTRDQKRHVAPRFDFGRRLGRNRLARGLARITRRTSSAK